MPPKRRKNVSESNDEFSSDDEETLYRFPDPDNSGDDDSEDDDDDFESESYDDIQPQKTYSQASKDYRDNQAKLEDEYVFEWVEGEKNYYGNVENICLMSAADKKKLQSMNFVQLFETFFSDELKNYIIQATQKNDCDLTMIDLNIFIGILISSSFNSRKSYKHYWSKDPYLCLEPIKSAMSRDKFQNIKSKLKYALPTDEDQNDRGWRVRKIINIFRKNIKQFGYFQAAMSVDEMMAKFFGRTILKQFIKGKPIRFGIKFWGLCTPDGYLLEFDLYCGKNSSVSSSKLSKCSLGSRVVLSLLHDFFTKVGVKTIPFYHLYMDNLFTSFDLVLHLKMLGLRSTGTLRENRVKKEDKHVISAKSPRGTYAVKHENGSGINYITLVDSKSVSMASTAAGVTPMYDASRRSKEHKEKVSIPFPNVFQVYNKYMGGVDVHDGRCNYASPCIRSKKWTWIVFMRLIQASIANAVVISNYVHEGKKKSSSLDFMLAISKDYLQQSKSPQNISHNVVKHEKMRTCVYCTRRTYKHCETCSKHICSDCLAKTEHK